MTACPSCGAENPDGARFCNGCAAALVPEKPRRAMVDLACAIARVGEDSHPTLERARAILLGCDARAFLFEVDDALAELAP